MLTCSFLGVESPRWRHVAVGREDDGLGGVEASCSPRFARRVVQTCGSGCRCHVLGLRLESLDARRHWEVGAGLLSVPGPRIGLFDLQAGGACTGAVMLLEFYFAPLCSFSTLPAYRHRAFSHGISGRGQLLSLGSESSCLCHVDSSSQYLMESRPPVSIESRNAVWIEEVECAVASMGNALSANTERSNHGRFVNGPPWLA
ncbi:hypothetical protein DFP72DRAFT_928063 [Ephemerocybe angulata]|uniref:Uncharacterized protein n=1 Tax=Ephemerocybe angulata TaxID=980116 RepID=A0A8H6HED6_9AGAR|nr:hypothetical protein DFP72DRAFT_928063 [Tulosesus angulatus]